MAHRPPLSKRHGRRGPSTPAHAAHRSTRSGFLYYDARGDDARVALALAKTAALYYGAQVATYVRAVDAVKNDAGRVQAMRVRDELSGEEFEIATLSVINATGVWADDVFAMAEHRALSSHHPGQGSARKRRASRLPADVAAVFNVPNDRRSVFVVPFEDAPYTYIGTTDTAYDGSLDEPLCGPDDVAYLLGAVNASTSSDLDVDDVTGVWAGLRPLLAPESGRTLSERTADLSRRHRVSDSRDGVVHVTGGKWTTYRQMAQDAVDALSPYVSPLGRVRTKSWPSSAWESGGPPTRSKRTCTDATASRPKRSWP